MEKNDDFEKLFITHTSELWDLHMMNALYAKGKDRRKECILELVRIAYEVGKGDMTNYSHELQYEAIMKGCKKEDLI